jgi:hypothetical protein
MVDWNVDIHDVTTNGCSPILGIILMGETSNTTKALSSLDDLR